MCYKAVHACFFVFDFIPDQYKIQGKCDIIYVLSLYTLLKVCCPDKYITQKKCDEAVDDSPAALKLIPDWFVRRKMIIKLYKGNWTRSHNHLAHKGTLKWLSVCL